MSSTVSFEKRYISRRRREGRRLKSDFSRASSILFEGWQVAQKVRF